MANALTDLYLCVEGKFLNIVKDLSGKAGSVLRPMFISEALLFGPEPQVRSMQPAPHIVVGITNSQTCLTLTGRLRALREAGFRVTLVSSPGELLDRTAERDPDEKGDCAARGYRFAGAALVAIASAQAGYDRIQHSQGRAPGHLGGHAGESADTHLYAARAQSRGHGRLQAPHFAGGGADGRILCADCLVQQPKHAC